MKKDTVNCKNCEAEFEEGFAFCPHCGQKAKDELTIGVLFYNTISNYFSFDARFFKSFIPLMIKPGYLAKKFLEGKRLLYLHPAQMYLFISVVFFFLFSFVAREQTEDLNTELRKTLNRDDAKVVVDSVTKRKQDSLEKIELRNVLQKNKFITGMNEKEIDSILNNEDLVKNDVNFGFNEQEIDSLIKAGAPDKELYTAMGMEEDDGWFSRKMYTQVLKFYKARDGGNILKAFYDTVPIALFFVLPLFALILMVFYFNKGRYAHHLVFSFYFFSYLFTVFSILVLLRLIWPDFSGWIIFLVMLSTFFYLFIALKRFYAQGWFLSFVKSGLVTFVFMPVVIMAAIAVLMLAFMYY